MRSLVAVLFATTILGLGAVRADHWDENADNDDAITSDNELIHGLSQQHDLGVRPGPTADLDFYPIHPTAWSSHEVLVDGATGNINIVSDHLTRLESDGTTVAQSGLSAGGGALAGSLTWVVQATPTVNYIRVGPGSCLLSCNANDRYNIRYYDTTVAVPRFNNAGSQLTILMVQNTGRVSVSGFLVFWTPAGALIATTPFTVPIQGLLVFNTSSVAAGTSGSITIPNTGRYGVLAAKSVALEPSTGFSFDTIGTYKPH